MSIGPQLQTKWDWRAAGNFIGGGSGSGLLLAAAVVLASGRDTTWLALPATLLVMAGLALVWLEIGRRLRFLNAFRNPRTSWMSREALMAVIVVVLGTASALTGSAILLLTTALPAALFLYTQGRILRASRGIPAWRLSEIVPLIVSTGLAEGAGLLLILLNLSGSARLPLPFMGTLVVALVLFRYIAWRCYWKTLNQRAPEGAIRALTPVNWTLLLLGTLLPGLLGLALTLDTGQRPLLAIIAGAAMLVAGWIAKFSIVTRAAFNQGYAIPLTPARGGGSIGPGSKPGWRIRAVDPNP